MLQTLHGSHSPRSTIPKEQHENQWTATGKLSIGPAKSSHATSKDVLCFVLKTVDILKNSSNLTVVFTASVTRLHNGYSLVSVGF